MKKIWTGITFAVVMVTASPAAQAQNRTVLVPIVPGNPLASGQALVDALAAIPSPSATNPWIIQLEPGLYEIPTIPLQMRQGVSLVGAGVEATEVRGTTPVSSLLDIGVVEGANNAELRHMTIRATAPPGLRSIAVQNFNVGSSMVLADLKLIASGGNVNCGLRNVAATPAVRDVSVAVTGGSLAYGIVLTSLSPLVELRQVSVLVTGGTEGYGIWVGGTSSLAELRNSEIYVRDADQSFGLYFSSDAGHQGTVLIANVEIDAFTHPSLTAAQNAAIWSHTPGTLRIQTSDLNATGATNNFGVNKIVSGGAIYISNSEISGSTQTVGNLGTVGVRSSGLNGGPVSAPAPSCAAVWDESGSAFPNSCPP